jgi:hypothetical protein
MEHPMAEELSPFDRGTIRTWRILNILGWTALGVLAAVFFRAAGEAAATVLFRSPGLGPFRHFSLGLDAAVAIPSSVVAGLAAGMLIGGRAYRWPVVLSGTAASLAALAWWFLYTGAFSVHGAAGLGTAAVMVPVACFAGRRGWRNKRLWPSGSRGSTETIRALADRR